MTRAPASGGSFERSATTFETCAKCSAGHSTAAAHWAAPEEGDVEEPLGEEHDTIPPQPEIGEGAEDPLGPTNEGEMDLGDDAEQGNEDAESHDLDVGAVELAIDETHGKKGLDDAAGIEKDAPDEFVPVFADEGDAGDEPHAEIPPEPDDDALPDTQDDGGAEGIGDGSESQLDEGALPAMDADAAGDFELNDLLEEMGFGVAEPWELVPSWGRDVALAAISTRDGAIAAAGAVVLVIDRASASPRVRALTEPAVACASTESAVLLATRRGVETIDFATLSPPRVLLERTDVTSIAVAGAQAWLLAGSLLLRLDTASGKAEIVRDDALAMGAHQSTLFVACGRGNVSLERLRGYDGSFESLEIDDAARSFLQRGVEIASSTPSALLFLREGRALIARVGGASTVVRAERVVAATFRGSGVTEGLRVLLVSRDERGLDICAADGQGAVTHILRVDPRTPIRTERGQRFGICWDAARELALVAGPQGLVAMRPRLQH